MDAFYANLQGFLNRNLGAILGNLGREFDSNDFITAFRILFPNEYADALRTSGSYRAIHTWVARWYLSRQVGSLKKGEISSRESVNRNPTKNRKWMKI